MQISTFTKQFHYYKSLGDKSFEQVSDEQLFQQFNEDSNSIAIIVKHISGNMKSRFTDFLTSDGEKDWRHRDQEFEMDFNKRDELIELWESGWSILFSCLEELTDDDFENIVYIRNEGHTVFEALMRQFAHYSYHIGQIVSLAKILTDGKWKSLSVPKGESKNFNQKMFSKPKGKRHFIDGVDEN